MIGLILMAFLMSATQDIATDALAARSFHASDRGLINSMQSMGSFAGSMVGSGGAIGALSQIRVAPYATMGGALCVGCPDPAFTE